jgi:cbb3-type cytochrome oxidase maturation protein
MDILYLLVPLSVVLAFAIGAAFWIAVEGGQFEDLDQPGVAVVADDDRTAPPADGS